MPDQTRSPRGADDVPIRVTAAIPTFRRNDHLVELIPLLVAQLDELTAAGDYDARVLIVDNDPAGGAGELVRGMGIPRVDYVHEERPGLAAVRNRALDESGSSRLLAFMDDDGRPADGWLVRLVQTWAPEHPAAVAGRVLERYETTPDPWIVAGEFFRRRSLPTGTVVPVAPAGNLLLDLEQVRRLGIRFDERFGLSGGEDTLLTRQLTAGGGRIVWCDESQVVDLVPTDRINRKWVLHRAWSHGNTAALVDLAMAPTRGAALRVRASALVGGLARMAGGGARYLGGLVTRSARHQARGLRTAFRGAGMLSGSVGAVVQEYAR